MRKVSVILGFKDWGLDRLRMCIESVHASLSAIEHEVVVCDYGSANGQEVSRVCSLAGARCRTLATDGGWSRSRALNAAFGVTTGGIIMATDADMLFTPSALTDVATAIHENSQQYIILQCRDLPVGFDEKKVLSEGLNWKKFERIAQIRPRWGAGGLTAITREALERLRGWDERMHTYGGEDLDLMKRAQRFGLRINWLDNPGSYMFHVWHPSTSKSLSQSPDAQKAIKANKAIHESDRTWMRNRQGSSLLSKQSMPIANVVVLPGEETDTFKTVLSILSQTVRDVRVFVPSEAYDQFAWDDRIVCSDKVRTSDLRQSAPATICARPGDIWSALRLNRLLEGVVDGKGAVVDYCSHEIVDLDGNALGSLVQEGIFDVASWLVRSDLLPESEQAPEGAIMDVVTSGVPFTVVPCAARNRPMTSDATEKHEHTLAIVAREFEFQFTNSGALEAYIQPDQIIRYDHDEYGNAFDREILTVAVHAPYIVLQEILENYPTLTVVSSFHVSDIDGSGLFGRLILSANTVAGRIEIPNLIASYDAKLYDSSLSVELTDDLLIRYAGEIYGCDDRSTWGMFKCESHVEAKELWGQLQETRGVNISFVRLVEINGVEEVVTFAKFSAKNIESLLELLSEQKLSDVRFTAFCGKVAK